MAESVNPDEGVALFLMHTPMQIADEAAYRRRTGMGEAFPVFDYPAKIGLWQLSEKVSEGFETLKEMEEK